MLPRSSSRLICYHPRHLMMVLQLSMFLRVFLTAGVLFSGKHFAAAVRFGAGPGAGRLSPSRALLEQQRAGDDEDNQQPVLFDDETVLTKAVPVDPADNEESTAAGSLCTPREVISSLCTTNRRPVHDSDGYLRPTSSAASSSSCTKKDALLVPDEDTSSSTCCTTPKKNKSLLLLAHKERESRESDLRQRINFAKTDLDRKKSAVFHRKLGLFRRKTLHVLKFYAPAVLAFLAGVYYDCGYNFYTGRNFWEAGQASAVSTTTSGAGAATGKARQETAITNACNSSCAVAPTNSCTASTPVKQSLAAPVDRIRASSTSRALLKEKATLSPSISVSAGASEKSGTSKATSCHLFSAPAAAQQRDTKNGSSSKIWRKFFVPLPVASSATTPGPLSACATTPVSTTTTTTNHGGQLVDYLIDMRWWSMKMTPTAEDLVFWAFLQLLLSTGSFVCNRLPGTTAGLLVAGSLFGQCDRAREREEVLLERMQDELKCLVDEVAEKDEDLKQAVAELREMLLWAGDIKGGEINCCPGGEKFSDLQELLDAGRSGCTSSSGWTTSTRVVDRQCVRKIVKDAAAKIWNAISGGGRSRCIVEEKSSSSAC
ncbi:unnamed protein product [Amoebophrya sp. A120]|nr:unnamed protein product [Amoebophrya sp. A120]|eukprot:GSA120T00013975001.1